MDIGGWEIAIVALVLLLLFGGKKLPEMARGLGSAKREFEKASKDDKSAKAAKADKSAKAERAEKAKTNDTKQSSKTATQGDEGGDDSDESRTVPEPEVRSETGSSE